MPVRKILPALLFVLVLAPSGFAQTAGAGGRAADAIRYVVRFPAPETHYLEVSATVPTGGRRDVELMMAVWTPGSYLVREYQRNVERVTASAAGRTLSIEKSAKNRWRVTTGGAQAVTVSYRVFAHEMSVRTNWVDANYALINGAPTFMTLADSTVRPHEVVLELPDGWRRSMTGLRAMAGGAHRYVAPDFDTLVDSPILAGNAVVYEFSVDGKPHYLVNEGEGGVFDGARAARDLEALIREQQRFWGALPYDKYVVLNVIGETRGGGLEHRNSTVLIAARATTRSRNAYAAWLTLASHELFHTWNGKRLRPVELGPFDYESEALTRSLWVVEGITDYYGDLLAHRAGLITRDEFLGNLSATIEELQTTPGRLVQSVELASFDAWIRYYRPDENSPNVSISYYAKGQVLAFLLDARIRHLTNGARSLDDVMRAAYAKYSGSRGFTPEQFREVAEQIAGASLADFWTTGVRGTQELDYTEGLSMFGLRFSPRPARNRASFGVGTRNEQGRLVVTSVPQNSAGAAAGLLRDDEILAIDESRVRADQLARRLEQYMPGARVSLLVARRDQLIRVPMTLGNEPGDMWDLGLDPAATDAQRARLAAWLRTPS
jgi:predicted metalloprotease with PDZ domain